MQSKKISVLDIPFSKLIKLEKSDRPEYLFKICHHPDLMNHLDTFHAGVLFSLAESTSGQFLLNEYNDPDKEIIPLIRKAVIKYSKPGTTAVYANANLLSSSMEEIIEILNSKKRVLIKVNTEVFNDTNERILQAEFDWFVSLNN